MPANYLLIIALCLLALAYRYYSAFLAAKVAVVEELRRTPAHVRCDGKGYHLTNRWVLSGQLGKKLGGERQ